jgi:hypothetical protein
MVALVHILAHLTVVAAEVELLRLVQTAQVLLGVMAVTELLLRYLAHL